MKQIALLDSDTINQIAAGEVVERPSSVVKELIENAVDAGASAVTCEIRDGGIAMIRVTDNGRGIDREDIETAFLRHATSKIRTALDLMTVGSLGFRGEALSSIAAVARVELISKTREDLLGVRYVIEGGEEKERQDVGSPDGTTIIVRDLFYNTPARRKFLKSHMTEAGYISDLMDHLALSRPDISFKLIVNGQTKLHTTGSGKLREVIYQVFGRDVTGQLLTMDSQTDLIRITGMIGKPILSRGSRSWENYFINSRYIKSPIVTKAIEEAYKTFVMVHKYPFTAIHIQIEPELIDVNVHPRKMELRFNQNEQVYRDIYHAIREVLEGRELIPAADLHTAKERTAERTAQQEAPVSAPEPFETRRRSIAQEAVQSSAVPGSVAFADTKAAAVTEAGMQMSQEIRNGAGAQISSEIGNGAGAQISPEIGNEADAKVSPEIHSGASAENAQGTEDGADPERVSGTVRQQPDGRQILMPSDSMITQVREEGIPYSTGKMPYRESAGKSVSGKRQEDRSENPPGPSPAGKEIRGQQMSLFEGTFLNEEARKKHRLIGQVFNTYWLIEYEKKLYIMDQHAAHEKVLYERFLKDFERPVVHSQKISPPVVVTLTPRELALYKAHEDHFARLGFEIDAFGGRDLAISGVPLQLFGMSIRDIFTDVLDNLSEDHERTASHEVILKIATMACKAAVKGGNLLSFEEADALIDELLAADNPYTCPHGRPTIISISQYEMEKKFKRIQS